MKSLFIVSLSLVFFSYEREDVQSLAYILVEISDKCPRRKLAISREPRKRLLGGQTSGILCFQLAIVKDLLDAKRRCARVCDLCKNR